MVIATGGEETRVMLWDGATGRLKRVLSGLSDFINAARVRDGRLLATGGADARVLVWDVAGGLRNTLLGHADEVAASPSAATAASSPVPAGTARCCSGTSLADGS